MPSSRSNGGVYSSGVAAASAGMVNPAGLQTQRFRTPNENRPASVSVRPVRTPRSTVTATTPAVVPSSTTPGSTIAVTSSGAMTDAVPASLGTFVGSSDLGVPPRPVYATPDACHQPYYFLIGQDLNEAQRFYHTQLALSQLSLNPAAAGVPLIQTNPNDASASATAVTVGTAPTTSLSQEASNPSVLNPADAFTRCSGVEGIPPPSTCFGNHPPMHYTSQEHPADYSTGLWINPSYVSQPQVTSYQPAAPVLNYEDPSMMACRPAAVPSLHWYMNSRNLNMFRAALAYHLQTPMSSFCPAINPDAFVPGGRRGPRNGHFAARGNAPVGLDLSDFTELPPNVNPIEFDESLLKRARYFVIKSDCEYNVRQSIRYGVWCSTRTGNQCLDAAYRSVQPRLPEDRASAGKAEDTDSTGDADAPGHILLFFSIRSTGCLSGVAEMIGPVDLHKQCLIWQDRRFRGEIPVRWIYVKNVPNYRLKHICIEAYENRSFTLLRDTSEVSPASKGELVMRIVHDYQPEPMGQANAAS